MDLKPIKTEYKGIVFDSKSEAIFARAMDIETIDSEGYKKIIWAYHPENFTINKYCPDFSVVQWYNNLTETGYMGGLILVEYKPTRPTQTYIDQIIQYFKDIKAKDSFGLISRFVIYYGNAFDGKCLKSIAICEYLNNEFIALDDAFLGYIFNNENVLELAKDYRFDLEHQQI